jgi:hypothetical protein
MYILMAMEEPHVFERLVKTLSREERQDMLERLQGHEGEVVSTEPLKIPEERTEFDFLREYHRLSFWEKVYITIKAIFTRQSKEETLEQTALARLGKRLEREYPQIFSYKTGELRSEFYNHLKKLQEHTLFLKEPCVTAFGKQKQDFFAFLAGWQMPDIQDRLLNDIEPEQVAYEKSLSDPHQVKKEIEYRLEDIIDSIDPERKRLLYEEVRKLHCLHSLVHYNFDKMIDAFEQRGAAEWVGISLSGYQATLTELLQLLSSIQSPPSEQLVKVLLIFYLQRELEKDDPEEFEQRLYQMLNKAESAFSYIRLFNRTVPLLDLLRLAKRNVEYYPAEIGGGEDWFLQFKQFWYRRFDEKIRRFTEEQKRKKIIEDALGFLKLDQFPRVAYYRSGEIEPEVRARYEESISFIRGFVERIFLEDMHPPLKLVLIDGQFYKEQNREEYNDAYNGLLQLKNDIEHLEYDLSDKGEVGKRIGHLRSEVVNPRLFRNKLAQMMTDVDKQAEQIITSAIDHVSMMSNLLGGILYGDMGGRFDTLSNLGYIGRNENKNLSQKLRSIKNRLEVFMKTLTGLYDTERRM